MAYMQNIRGSLMCFTFLRPPKAQNILKWRIYICNAQGTMHNQRIITHLNACKEPARRTVITHMCFRYAEFWPKQCRGKSPPKIFWFCSWRISGGVNFHVNYRLITLCQHHFYLQNTCDVAQFWISQGLTLRWSLSVVRSWLSWSLRLGDNGV